MSAEVREGSIASFNSHEIDPHSQVEGGHMFHFDASHSDYILLQNREHIYNSHIRELAQKEAKIHQLLDHHTCICEYKPHDLEKIRALPWVLYANVFHQDLVVSQRLQHKIHTSQELRTDRNGSPQTSKGSQRHAVYVQLHRGSEKGLEELITELVQLGLPRETLERYGETAITAEVKSEDLKAIAAIDDVMAIEEQTLSTLHNNSAGEIIRPALPPVAGVAPVNTSRDGENQFVAVADSGLDTGDLNNIHPAFNGGQIEPAHLIPIGRALDDPNKHPLNIKGQTNDVVSHGTHVAATILGAYFDKEFPVADKDHFIEGIATGAKLVFQSLGKYVKDGNKDIYSIGDVSPSTLYEVPYKLPAPTRVRIHSSSWGSFSYNDIDRGYGTQPSQVDALAVKYPDLLIIRAAGNQGDTEGGAHQGASIAYWACAKNSLTVGACFSNRPSNLEPFPPPTTIPRDPKDIPMFSNRGPTKQGVIKPDLVAPGVAILSARSQDPAAPAGRTKLSAFASGTSAATPVVAGAAACLRQALVADQGEGKGYPTSALIKAILINTATDLHELQGSLDYGTVSDAGGDLKRGFRGNRISPAPNGVQGWGRVNLALAVRAVDSPGGMHGYFEAREPPLKTLSLPGDLVDLGNDFRRWHVDVPVPGSLSKGFDLLVHLVYTDQQGPGLVNQLLMRVEEPGGRVAYSNGKVENDPNLGAVPWGPEMDVTKDTNVKHVVLRNVKSGRAWVQVEALRLVSEQACAVAWRLKPL